MGIVHEVTVQKKKKGPPGIGASQGLVYYNSRFVWYDSKYDLGPN